MSSDQRRFAYGGGTWRNAAVGAALLLCPLAGEGQAQQAPAVLALEDSTPNQILFVGNSYLYYGDSLHNHVVRMAREAYPDERFGYKSATISGAYLWHHDINSYLFPGALGLSDPYDVVILQGHSTATTTPEKLDRFRQSATDMARSIEAAGGKVALYMTPAYSEDHDSYDPDMFAGIYEGYTAVGNEIGALVIPVGLAFEIAYERRPDIELHKSFDGSHPTLLGTYLAAATTFAALYGEPVVGNPYTYFGAIDDDDAAFLQQVAEDAVATYYAG